MKLEQGYVFTCVCDSVHRGGVGIPAYIVGGIQASLAARSLGGGIPACLAGLQAHTQGEVEESGLGRGCLKAHTWGVSRPTLGEGSPGLHQGVSRPTPRGYPGPHPGGSTGPHLGGSQHALRQTPPNGYCCGQYASYWNAFLFCNSKTWPLPLCVGYLFHDTPVTNAACSTSVVRFHSHPRPPQNHCPHFQSLPTQKETKSNAYLRYLNITKDYLPWVFGDLTYSMVHLSDA